MLYFQSVIGGFPSLSNRDQTVYVPNTTCSASPFLFQVLFTLSYCRADIPQSTLPFVPLFSPFLVIAVQSLYSHFIILVSFIVGIAKEGKICDLKHMSALTHGVHTLDRERYFHIFTPLHFLPHL